MRTVEQGVSLRKYKTLKKKRSFNLLEIRQGSSYAEDENVNGSGWSYNISSGI